MDVHNEFIAREKALVFYRGKAILNKVHRFLDINGDAWSFSGAVGFTFKIWEEREGGLQVVDWSSPINLSNNLNDIILNAPVVDTASIGIGKYYYEIEYITAGGYPVLVGFGEAKFI